MIFFFFFIQEVLDTWSKKSEEGESYSTIKPAVFISISCWEVYQLIKSQTEDKSFNIERDFIMESRQLVND